MIKILSLSYFPGGSDGKASVYNVRDLGSVPGLGRFLEKEMATHCSTLALKIPWTEELGAGYCPWGHKELDTTERSIKKVLVAQWCLTLCKSMDSSLH